MEGYSLPFLGQGGIIYKIIYKTISFSLLSLVRVLMISFSRSALNSCVSNPRLSLVLPPRVKIWFCQVPNWD